MPLESNPERAARWLPASAAGALIVAGWTLVAAGPSAAQTPPSPQALLDAWVQLWDTYDLDPIAHLFVTDDRLTYFSSETQGLIRGFDAVVEHHRGFGFEAGGAESDPLIWVDDVEIVDLGASAVIGAVWYFGDPDQPDAAQRGPMTLVALATDDGYRIVHMHFATYVSP